MALPLTAGLCVLARPGGAAGPLPALSPSPDRLVCWLGAWLGAGDADASTALAGTEEIESVVVRSCAVDTGDGAAAVDPGAAPAFVVDPTAAAAAAA